MVDAREIYVQLPAYRDKELSDTLIDLYAKAQNPERLRTCVLWQRGPRERLSTAALKLPRLQIIEVPAAESKGCNWARRILQQQWKGEHFTLLLDSHHRFASDWDQELVGMFDGLQAAGVQKPVLTAYLPSYDPDNDPDGRLPMPFTIYPRPYEDGLLIRLTSYPMPFWKKRTAPVPTAFLSLHFVFTLGRFNVDIPFDPEIYFFGDEMVTGLRAFSWGYDMFHPHRVIGWHNYDRSHRRPHWDDHSGWHSQHQASLSKIRQLFAGHDPSGALLGPSRSAKDYADLVLIPLIAPS
jgi:hypothetical protein